MSLVKQFEIEAGIYFLHLPVKNGNPLVRGAIELDGRNVDEFLLELAGDRAEFYTAVQFFSKRKQLLKIKLDVADLNEAVLENISISRKPGAAVTDYREKYRPQIHFTTLAGWINDPNGLIYYNEKYHLYYQYNPYGCRWGNMHWGHAVSDDMLHWEEKPVAVFPKKDDWAFSGCAAMDEKNTSGFRKNNINPLLAFYTSTGRGECLLLSYDDGDTFDEFHDNPLIKHKGRDPFVFWYEKGMHWVMAVYEAHFEEKAGIEDPIKIRGIAIYTSADLKSWQYQSFIPGYYECPVLFPAALDGNEADLKWVLFAANEIYQVGDFDGKQFVPRQAHKQLSRGNIYASQIYSGLPQKQNRIVRMACATIAFPNMPFNQMMAFPTELSLKSRAGEMTLCALPVKEINNLIIKTNLIVDQILVPGQTCQLPVNVIETYLGLTLDLLDCQKFSIQINGFNLIIDPVHFKIDDSYFPIVNAEFSVNILVDRMSIEIFADDGRFYKLVSHNSVDQPLALKIQNLSEDYFGRLFLRKIEVNDLKSIWLPGMRR